MDANRNFWLDRPVFVTGATGLCGSALVKRLLELRSSVVVLIRDWVPESELISRDSLLSQVTVVRGEVEDRAKLERIINEYEIRTVFHLAAQTIVGTANRNPTSTFETNIAGTWNVLESCRRTSTIQEVVVASSDKAYGSHDELPYSEDIPLIGRHPYDVSKSCADLIAQSYAHTFGLPVVVTRCGNLYGPGDLNWNRLIPGTIRSAIRGENPYIRSDGTSVRDYFYVEDAAIAYITLAEAINTREGVKGEAFNFSNEIQVTVAELAQTILSLMGKEDLELVIGNDASNEIIHQYLSASKAKDLLGWSPSFTLNDGLSRTIEWYRHLFDQDEVSDISGSAGSAAN